MSIENGGPAFPIPGKSYSYPEGRFEDDPYCGMTLRDYFAAQIMAAQVGVPDYLKAAKRAGRDFHGTLQGLAKSAYAAADAMLAARNEHR